MTRHRLAALFMFAPCLIGASAWANSRTIIVAADGTGEFTTVQAAINAVPSNNTERVTLRIRPGTYKEKITIPKDRPLITLMGEDANSTVLTNDWNAKHIGPDGKEVGTGGSCSVKVEGSDFVAENITFENTAGDTGQAVALAAVGDRQIYRHCRLLGWQDTLYANAGRQYYDECYIEGRVDFVFGSATAVFDRCHLHSKNGGHVTAASTAQDALWGYVFLDCTLTGNAIPWKNPTSDAAQSTKGFPNADLGRPWRPYASVTFVRCEIGNHIMPQGWDNWHNPANEKTARYAEYKCIGPGADRSRRVAWSKELSDEEAGNVTVANILGGQDGWQPNRKEPTRSAFPN